MEREPSIHVTRSTLIRIVKGLGIHLSKPNIDRIMREARGVSADNRTMVATKVKETRQVRRTNGTIQAANIAAELAYGIRVKKKHIGVTKIKQTDPAWAQVRELVPSLNIFCETYNLPQRKGYLEFLMVGFNLMELKKANNFNYWASWMLKHADWINQTYQNNNEIKTDEYPRETQQLMSLFSTKVSEMTGMYSDYSKNNNDYVHFIRARKLADRLGVDYETFIDAQFEALAFCNGIPRLVDLDNEKAEERLTKYIAKTGIQVSSHKLSESTWDDFKK